MLGSARSVLMKAPTAAPPSLPAAYASYNLNENTGTTAADSSGNSHPLTVANATWATGHTGSGLSNTTGSNGATSTSLTVPTTFISIMAWIKPLQLAANDVNLAVGFFNGSSTIAAIFTQRGDYMTPNVTQVDIRTGGVLLHAEGTALTVGTWTHVAAVYDGSVVRLYQDGSLTATSSIQAGTIAASSEFYVAGSSTVINSQVVVDDVRVFDIALTQTQVNTAMNTPVA